MHFALVRLAGRERQFARVAATGTKTEEISAQPFLSPRTVELPLTRVYHKLGVPSRAALARMISKMGGCPTGGMATHSSNKTLESARAPELDRLRSRRSA